MTLLGLQDAMTILEQMALYITNGCKKFDLDKINANLPCPVLDVDLLDVFMFLNASTRSKFFTKTLEVSYTDCTCHVKCMGKIGQSKILSDYFKNELLINNFSTRICGQCHLSHVIDNTTSGKPRKNISATNPAMTTCSMDACSVTMILRYLIYERTKNWLFYGHRFYITKSSAVTDTIYRGQKSKCSSATGRTAGVCYGGRRTGLKLSQNLIFSSKQFGLTEHFSNRMYWWSCSGCKLFFGDKPNKDNHYQYDCEKHSFFQEEIHKGTCLSLFYNTVVKKHQQEEEEKKDLKQTVKQCFYMVCEMCQIVALCRHSLNGLMEMYAQNPYSNVLLLQIKILHYLIQCIKCK